MCVCMCVCVVVVVVVVELYLCMDPFCRFDPSEGFTYGRSLNELCTVAYDRLWSS